jgi:intracellular multiplication protein IcmC
MNTVVPQVFFLLIVLTYTQNVYASSGASAGTTPSLQEMLTKIADLRPVLVRLVSGFSYVAGFAFVVRSIYQLKEYGESRTMMSSHTAIVGPMTLMIIGGALIYLPTVIDDLTLTVFGSNNPISYPESGESNYDLMVKVIINIMYVVGGIAAVRGLMLLTRATSQQSQPGTFAQAIAHLVGGVLALNVYWFWVVIKTTLGFT